MTEAEFLSRVRQLVPGNMEVEAGTIEQAVPAPGAYALLLRLAVPLRFSRNGIVGASLSGWYVYAGSARGSGGIRGRLRHHFRRGKPVRWHVDELTNSADRIVALSVPGGSECEIVGRLLQSHLFEPALSGFGSSDCRHCTAHLLRPVR